MWRSIAFFGESIICSMVQPWHGGNPNVRRKKYFVLMENGKDTSQYLREQPRGAALKAATRGHTTIRLRARHQACPRFHGAFRWLTSLLAALHGSQTRSRRPTSRSKASSTFECWTLFLLPTHRVVHWLPPCQGTVEAQHLSSPFIDDELINTAVYVQASSGTWDVRPLRREAVTPNERTREANATTKGDKTESAPLG